ncbi:MAG: hypothetical protein MI920_23995 [Kiloniellales bacterium]|nr:hypothetical protein [Kiloniellales bacterium]
MPLTRGDVTRNPAIQVIEDAASRGAFGPAPQATATGVRAQQQAALLESANALQRRLAGGSEVVLETGQGMARVQGRLLEQADFLRQRVRDSYQAARTAGGAVLPQTLRDAGRLVRRELLSSFNPRTAPQSFGLAQDLAGFTERAPGRITSVKLQALENWRQQVSALSRSNNPVEAAAASRLREGFDQFMDRVAEQGLLLGDEGALQAFKQSRSLSRELVLKFREDNIVASIIDTAPDISGQRVLRLTPEEALNKVFTANALGGKEGSTRALQRLRVLLGEKEP